MDLWQLLLVALVQGFTEFLPVSSSAHLILLPQLLGSPDQGLSFDVAAHTGTFVAAAAYFRRDLHLLGRGLASAAGRRSSAHTPERRLFWLVAAASWPVLVGGWLFRSEIATAARDATVIAVTSIVFGVVLAVADRRGTRRRDVDGMSSREAFAVGCSQALALVPGTSRSGVTISAGLLLGLKRDEAARFSFVLSIPVSAAVALSELSLLLRQGSGWLEWELLLVTLVSAVVGFACIHGFLGFVRKRSLLGFAVYRVVLGIALLIAAGWF